MSKFDWMDDALCREIGSDIFEDSLSPSMVKYARQVCFQCKAQEPCLQYGIKNISIEGIVGGYSQSERRRMRKEIK